MAYCKIFKFFVLSIGLVSPRLGWADTLPKAFRDWRHVKSMVITNEKSGLYGFHNIYANPKAVKGMAKMPYENGAEFVASFYKVVQSGENIEQGAKIMDVTMKKENKAQTTGGWTFAAFNPDGTAKNINPSVDCFACHQAVKGSDYVFSKYVD